MVGKHVQYRSGIVGAALFLTSVGLAPNAYAKKHPPGHKPKFELSTGFFLTNNDTELRLDSSQIDFGITVNLEDDLGLKQDKSTFRADSIVRLGTSQRSRLDFTFYKISRDTDHFTIDDEIEFGDAVFPIHADISANFKGSFFKGDYTYMFVNKERYDFGASVGIFFTSLNASISEETLGTYNIDKADIDAPLPTVGIRGSFMLGEKFQAKASADTFFLSTAKNDGHMYDLRASVEYDLAKHVGVGLGLNLVDLDVDLIRTNRIFHANWGYEGAFLYLNLKY